MRGITFNALSGCRWTTFEIQTQPESPRKFRSKLRLHHFAKSQQNTKTTTIPETTREPLVQSSGPERLPTDYIEDQIYADMNHSGNMNPELEMQRTSKGLRPRPGRQDGTILEPILQDDKTREGVL